MKFILSVVITLFCFQNLSAYEEISIQKTSGLNNYQDLLKLINNSISDNDISNIIESHLYNINFSNSDVSFNIDIAGLSKILYQKEYNFNLLILNCSLRENFFKFNQNYDDCPNFKILSFNKDRFIYINYKDTSYRLKKFILKDDPYNIWLNFLKKNSNQYQTYIDPVNYSKIKKFTGIKPKILSYKNNLVEIESNSYFSEKQIQFLLNFF